MNHRLTIAAAVAVILASVSEWVLISGAGWLSASIGAVIIVALAGTATRLVPTRAAIIATVVTAAAAAPLLADRSVWLKVLGLILIAVCAASGTRLRFLSPVADAATYLSALLLYLNLVLSHGKSIALVIPTSKSLHHLSVLASQGMAAAKDPPPVATSAGVILLAAASIGLAAIVVDVLAVQMNRPAIAGLPLLVIYLAPIATAAKTGGPGGIVTFLLAATGYLGLLASDGRNRLRGWGRIVTVWHYAGEDDRLGGADIRGLAATGRRIGLAAVCAAIVAPLLLPSLSLHRLFTNHSGGVRHVQVGLPVPLVQLSKLLASPSSAKVLSYHSSGGTGQYLQVYVLNYNSSKGVWSLVDPRPSISIGTTALRPPSGLSPSLKISHVTTRVKLGNIAGSGAGFAASIFFLPVPYWPTQLSLGGSWSQSVNTEMIYSGAGNHSNMSYSVTNGQVNLTPADEEAANGAPPPAISRSYLTFNSPVTHQLQSIANNVTKDAISPFDKARALENYFQTGGFRYTLKADLPNTPRGLLRFLTTDKRGFCEQFAFAMAVLARLEGIPSRIAVGYTSGTEHSGGNWQVTTADAHAWPELYFTGLGWLRFEPTPGGPSGQGTAVQPSYALTAGQGHTGPSKPGGSNKTGSNGQQRGRGISNIRHHLGDPGSDPLPSGSTVPISKLSSPVPVGQIALAFLALLIVAALVPGTARIFTRHRRWRGAADDTGLANVAWQEICADLDDFGIARRLSETPRAVARRLSTDADIDEPGRQAISRIADVVERCRYSPTPATAKGVRADVTQVRRALARSSGVLIRLRAILFPASTIEPFTRNVREGIGQVTGWVPSATES
ncbi:MAG TPA: DUF3488 and transglutaminase-like domain-containing protein [Streptosporangiaceae bacterium]|nr:DUF3488 and transglutaminase-like domain-containing protein [Streptosporangiaceae bacterium]